jgi:hypothetical protein
VLRIFIALKNRLPWTGFEPATVGSSGKHTNHYTRATETWKSDTVIRRELQTFINSCLRKILNIHWPEKIRTEELLELAGEEPVQTQIKRRKWRCIGHTLRK